MIPKAYLVTEPNENTGGVVFAASDIEARRWGAGEWNDGELSGMSAIRRKDFDQYHGKGVPARILVAEGWHFECHGCWMRIEEWALEDVGLTVDGVVGTESSQIYCCAECESRALACRAREKAAGEDFLAQLRRIVTARFGPIEFVTGRYMGRVYAVERDGHVMVEQAVVSFNFPGQQLGPASLRYDWDRRVKVGPPHPAYMVCNGDREAFESWAAVTRGAE